jgi:hypothetical protein
MRNPLDASAEQSLFDVRGEDTTEVLVDTCPPRDEKRESVVRVVEYSRYPRVARDERRLVGFTRNQSRSGMCIVTSNPEVEGTLLRVALRTVDGAGTLDALAHVVWCERRTDGRYWIGLALLERAGRRMLKVRRVEAVEEDAGGGRADRFAAPGRGGRMLESA